MKNYTTPGFGGIAEQLKAQLEAEAAEASGSELLCGVLFGVLTRVGTMNVSGEETIGCAITMTEEALRSAPRLPMYRRVAIVVAEDYERLDRYCSALDNHHRLAAEVRCLLHNGGAGPNLSQLKRCDVMLREIAGLPAEH